MTPAIEAAPGAAGDPHVAVIVVNYETPDLTIRCVQSLLRSNEVRVRVFVIDNASRDGSGTRLSGAWAARDAVTVHARAINGGYAGGANAGFALAHEAGARYAVLLNSDTVVDPDCLRRLVEEADRDERIALVSPRIFFSVPRDVLWFGGGRFSLWTGRPVHVGLGRAARAGWPETRDESFATGCAVLVRLEALGMPGFDESLFAYAEDLDVSLRLRRLGYRLRYVPQATVWHDDGASHRHEGGEALRYYLTTRNTIRVAARHARWYHWVTLAPMLAVNVVGRYCVVAGLRAEWRVVAAVLRGALDSVRFGRSSVGKEPC